MVRTLGSSAQGGSASGGHPIHSMYYFYILRSLTDRGSYIGSTQELVQRLKEHNAGKTKSIKHRIPFEIVYSEEYKTTKEARQREIIVKKNYQIRRKLLVGLGFDVK